MEDKFTPLLGVARQYVFAKCKTGGCDIDKKPCMQCKLTSLYLARAMEQPCESMVMFPTVFFEQGMPFRGPTMYHAIISYYHAVMDLIQQYCEPDIKLFWHDEKWNDRWQDVRITASEEYKKRKPMMEKDLSDHMGDTHLSVIKAFEHCIFTGMAIMEECGAAGSKHSLDARIEKNLQKKLDEFQTTHIFSAVTGRAGSDHHEQSVKGVQEWNKRRKELH